jgi:DNA repair exonuclease SbcCD ATPase subunit
MRVDRLDIRGYGRLQGSFDFISGLTLVTGANEAGKSTLHDAVIRSLFGFSPEERRHRRDGSSAKEDRVPWSGRQFALTLHAHDLENQEVLVRWDFASDLVELQDAVTGRSQLREQPKQRGDYAVGRRLLGMTREEFIQVCCLYQEALGPVRASEELHAALQRAVESAPATDIGVDSADERLRRLLSTLGVHSGHYGKLTNGKLQELSQRQARLEEALATAREQRADLDQIAAKLETARHTRAEQQERVLATTQSSMRTTAAALQQRLQRAQQLLAQQGERPDNMQMLEREAVGRELQLRNQLASLEQRSTPITEQIAASAQQTVELEEALVATQARVKGLEHFAGVDASGERETRRLVALIGATGSQPTVTAETHVPPERDPTLARFREQRDTLIAQQAGTLQGSWNSALLAVALVLAVAGATGAAIINPALVALLLAAAVIAWLARPRASLSVDAASEGFDGRSFQELDQASVEEDRRFAAHVATEAAREQARIENQTKLDDLHRQLQLHLAPFEDLQGDLIDRAEEYLAHCEGARKLAEATAEQQRIAARVNELRGPASQLPELTGEREDIEEQLRELYRNAGLDPENLTNTAAAFAELVTRLEGDQARATRANQATAAIAELLGKSTLEDLERELQHARTSLIEHERAHGQLAAEKAPPQSSVMSAEDELQRSDIEITELTTILERSEANLGDPASLEVELAQVTEELERIEGLAAATKIAREALHDAAQTTHRRVAPHLNDALKRELPRITRGRYRDVAVDEDLQVKLYAPESGSLVRVAQLSRGTRDQVALVQRLEIARLLDPTAGHAPLLLDDPFAHFDPERLALGIDLIRDVAESRQVILFTESTEVTHSVRTACPSCGFIELRDPVEEGEPEHLALQVSSDRQ